jgi:hypothetical protein
MTREEKTRLIAEKRLENLPIEYQRLIQNRDKVLDPH